MWVGVGWVGGWVGEWVGGGPTRVYNKVCEVCDKVDGQVGGPRKPTPVSHSLQLGWVGGWSGEGGSRRVGWGAGGQAGGWMSESVGGGAVRLGGGAGEWVHACKDGLEGGWIGGGSYLRKAI